MLKENEKTLTDAIAGAAELLAKVVVPIYKQRGSRPFQIGSGFLVRAGSSDFLVSAAHVFDEGRQDDLFYYITPNTIRDLSGPLLLSPWTGDREADPVDVGVLKLRGFQPPYPAVGKAAVDISYLRPRLLPRFGKSYMVIGFAASKTKVNPVAKEANARADAFQLGSLDDPEYSRHGLSPGSHVALLLGLKNGVDAGGAHRNFPNPKGMSGSPIWMLYDRAAPTAEMKGFAIVAAATKYRKRERLLIGTDIGVAVRMIANGI